MKEGWVCPKCGRVNAPFIPYCDCANNKPSSNISVHQHKWEFDGLYTGGSITHVVCVEKLK